MEWQEEQPMTLEAKHYIITVGSHWLGTRPSRRLPPRLTMGISVPQAPKGLVLGLQKGPTSRRSRLCH